VPVTYQYAGQYGPIEILSATGYPVKSSYVDVYKSDGVTLATLYTDRTKATTKSNPVLTDALGNLTVFADPGEYYIAGNGSANIPIVILVDPVEPDYAVAVATAAPGATPTLNVATNNVFSFTGLAAAITSMTTNLSGTGSLGDQIEIQLTDNGTARAITWGADFEASTVALPTTTVANALLYCRFIWNVATSKWRIVQVA
jgi:hypothetical protein